MPLLLNLFFGLILLVILSLRFIYAHGPFDSFVILIIIIMILFCVSFLLWNKFDSKWEWEWELKWINDFIETTKDLLIYIYYKLKRKTFTKGNSCEDWMLHLSVAGFFICLCAWLWFWFNIHSWFFFSLLGFIISCTFHSFVSYELPAMNNSDNINLYHQLYVIRHEHIKQV